MDLTPDTKYCVALNLSAKELINFCNTDSEMRRLCYSSKFNPIWQKHIKNDYGIEYNGKNAYMEYMQNNYFFNQTFLVVTVFDMEENRVIESEIFKTFDEAIQGIFFKIDNLRDKIFDENDEDSDEDDEDVINLIPYPVVKIQFEVEGFIYFAKYKIEMTEGKFSNHYSNKEDEYKKQLNKLVEITNFELEDKYFKDDIILSFGAALGNSFVNFIFGDFVFEIFWRKLLTTEPFEDNKNIIKIEEYLRQILK